MSDTTTLTNRALAERAGLHIIIGAAAVWSADCKQEYIHEYWEDSDGWPHRIPNYLASVDAALTLPLDDECRWSIFGADDYWWVDIIDEVGGADDRASACGATAAQAVSQAWWNWRNTQEAR